MPEEYYKDAQKLAQKEYRACVSNGVYPYLPALDEMLGKDALPKGVDLGLVQIPTDHIVGTKTAGRTAAFARNFMPLLDGQTEFATKWRALCTAHLKEGIREPIKVYEYMNRYYVEEGNKRVSVLKFFDAVNIPAKVTRILPARTGDKAVELYYEFVEFYKYSKLNCLELTKSGGYAMLQRLMGKQLNEVLSVVDTWGFRTAFYFFDQAFRQCGGGKLNITTGDAMLAYMKIFGYQQLRQQSLEELKKSVTKAWKEITLQQEPDPIDVKLNPEGDKKGFLSKVLTPAPKKRKVAFIHDKDAQTSGWTRAHELGRDHVQRVFQDKITTTTYYNALEQGAEETLERAIADGNTILFTTSPRLLPASLRAAIDHPNITILNCSLNKSHRNVPSYYARIYEAKFIIGAIAGTLSQDGRVGYLCDYPIYGMMAGVNAFALGVQMVNPRARVYLEWSSTDNPVPAAQRLTQQGVELISYQDMAMLQTGKLTDLGLVQVKGDSRVNLAAPMWHWGVYYENILRSIFAGTFQSEDAKKAKALNYYWGMSTGVVDVVCSDKLPHGTQQLVDLLRQGVCSGQFHPFRGPLHTQDGQIIDGDCNQNHVLSVEQIINMDWLVDGIVGTIPAYDELTDESKATVDMVGISRLVKDTQL